MKQSTKYTRAELNKCLKAINKILDDNDWVEGYQFRSSEWFTIKSIATSVSKDAVELRYTLQYKTRVHCVLKDVTRRFDPGTLTSLQQYIDKVEQWMMFNSGDMDDKQLIFGKRFNRIRFAEEGWEERGWKLKY